MSQYRVGTIAVTNGSAAVTGTGTAWLANVAAGNVLFIPGDTASYQLAGPPSSDTSLTLAAPYGGATRAGIAYGITRDFTPNYNLPYPQDGDIGTGLMFKRAMLLIDAMASSLVAPATSFNGTIAEGFSTNDIASFAGAVHHAFEQAGVVVGSVTTGGGATFFNTLSDRRTKNLIGPLTGALEIVRRMAAILYRHKGHDQILAGFFADEIQQLVPCSVTGEPGATNPDGSIIPQQFDPGRLVPYLAAALVELDARVSALSGEKS
ncbi:MAG: Chaperone of endosialidase [Rhodospirillales bacterium]|nr:Chaperone of endosialidase [Rhodospirillales bacterium]